MVWIFFCRARASSSAFVGQKNVINQTVNAIKIITHLLCVYIYIYMIMAEKTGIDTPDL